MSYEGKDGKDGWEGRSYGQRKRENGRSQKCRMSVRMERMGGKARGYGERKGGYGGREYGGVRWVGKEGGRWKRRVFSCEPYCYAASAEQGASFTVWW